MKISKCNNTCVCLNNVWCLLYCWWIDVVTFVNDIVKLWYCWWTFLFSLLLWLRFVFLWSRPREKWSFVLHLQGIEKFEMAVRHVQGEELSGQASRNFSLGVAMLIVICTIVFNKGLYILHCIFNVLVTNLIIMWIFNIFFIF